MKNFHSILRCNSRSHSRSFPGITTSHSRSQNAGMEFPFPFPKIGNGIFPFPFPKVGNEIFHSRSRSQSLGMGWAIPVPVPKWPKVIPAHPWIHLGTLQHFKQNKGSLQIEFLEKFGNLAQPGRPPPSPKVGTPKTKKKLMFILHFRLFWAFYFFVKIFIFLVGMTN